MVSKWILTLLFAVAAAAQPAPTEAQAKFRISGTVVDAVRGDALPDIEVSISVSQAESVLHTVITGPDGRFEFAGLAPTKYSLSGRGNGYLPQGYEQHHSYFTGVVAENEWAAIQAQPQADTELKEEVRKFLTFPKWFINSPDSPVWYRGLALESEQTLAPDLEAMLARLNIGYLVIAHTPQPDGRIHARFGAHVFLIDTGMLQAVFGGRASALEINGGRFTAYYVNEKPQGLPAPVKVANSTLVPNRAGSRPQP